MTLQIVQRLLSIHAQEVCLLWVALPSPIFVTKGRILDHPSHAPCPHPYFRLKKKSFSIANKILMQQSNAWLDQIYTASPVLHSTSHGNESKGQEGKEITVII